MSEAATSRRFDVRQKLAGNPAAVLTGVFVALFIATDIVNRAQSGEAFLTGHQLSTTFLFAAVVLGGVSLLGGVGGLIGVIAAAFVLTLVKTILIIKGVDQNYAQVIQGSLIVLVVMIGGLAIRQKGKSGG